MTLRRCAALALLFPLLSSVPTAADAQMTLSCAPQAEDALQSLSLGDDTVNSVRLERMLNPTEQGPDYLGVRAWVRLRSCSGFLVIDMTRSCFVRQSYTRGDCTIDGVTRY